MRKNTARHWLHAALDLLPVILIPVFMIYSHRHVLTERTEVDIQYKYQSNEVTSYDDLINGNIYYCDELIIGGQDLEVRQAQLDIFIYKIEEMNLSTIEIDEVYLSEYENSNSNYIEINLVSGNSYLYMSNGNGYTGITIYDDVTLTSFIFQCNQDIKNWFVYFELDLPQYTDYNVIESVDVQDTNSSIMNVFMDDFNYSVNKYFNMGNVFNLKDVYHWFEVNIFNNNPPVVMASIYNIIVYEFVMDLLFLLYGLFMWFVDMLKRLIEKPIDSIK